MSRAVMQQALQYVESNSFGGSDTLELIDALRKALAQPEQEPSDQDLTIAYMAGAHAGKKARAKPEQEPVAWMYVNDDGECEQIEYGEPFDDPDVTPLYTAPPQRQPLTDEQIDGIVVTEFGLDADADAMNSFARAIEAAHGIKGAKP